MKKILFFAVAIITIVSTSCTDQQKVKSNVKRYLGDDVKVINFVYNETDTIYTYDEKFELAKKSQELFVYSEKDYDKSELFYSVNSTARASYYLEKSTNELVESNKLLKAANKLEPKMNIVRTATVVSVDKNGKHTTEKYVISSSHTVSGTVSGIGMSAKEYKASMKNIFNK